MALVLVALVVLYVGALTFPGPLFANKAGFGGFRVYADEAIPADFGEVIEEVERRVEAMEHQPAGRTVTVYLCRRRQLYAFFAFLTRKSPESLAISLSVTQSMFVSTGRLEEFATRNRGRLRHTRFEGNPAEAIAHEIAHFNSVRALGYRAHLKQPVWKSEGWAEYQANLAAIHEDPAYDLGQRIDTLLDDGLWSSGRSLARDLWEWQLLVEYLGEVEGYDLAGLASATVRLPDVRQRMLEWHRAEASARSSCILSRPEDKGDPA